MPPKVLGVIGGDPLACRTRSGAGGHLLSFDGRGRRTAPRPQGRSRRDRAAAALDAGPVRALLARLPLWRGVLTLNYHRIGDPAGTAWDPSLWSATADGFDAQLAFLTRHADVIGPADLPDVVAAGRGRHVLITFDDGYRDNYEIAFPLLRRHRLSATFFLTTGFLDRPHPSWWDEIAWMVRHATAPAVPAAGWLEADIPLAGRDPVAAARPLTHVCKHLPADRIEAYLDFLAEATGAGRCPSGAAAELWMTWEMAREMRDGGMAIGGHTVTHPVLAHASPQQQQEEVAHCARRLREELDLEMRWFSYPVGFPGSFDATTRAALARHGVELAFSFYGGYGRYRRWDRYDIPRVYVSPALDRRQLHAVLRAPQLFARPSANG